MPEQDIKEVMVNNELIGRWMGGKPEIEYCVGNDTGSCFHPKHCGTSWPPKQKQECEKWLSQSEWAKREGYEVKKEEWWPWYNQDWNKLMEAWYKFRELKFDKEIDQFHHSGLKGLISHAICYKDIQIAYDEICKAIKWYNSINK